MSTHCALYDDEFVASHESDSPLSAVRVGTESRAVLVTTYLRVRCARDARGVEFRKVASRPPVPPVPLPSLQSHCCNAIMTSNR
jgi:hypothetical protein